MKILIKTNVKASVDKVWNAWSSPKDITQWYFASIDWCCPDAKIELIQGGAFTYRMEAKDGSVGFDFSGKFTDIVEKSRIEYVLEDDRKVLTTFTESEQGTTLSQTFETEDEHSGEQQKQGWQSILDNFKHYVENKA